MNYKKLAGILIILLGIIHLLAEITSPKLSELLILQQMNEFKIELLGSHTLYEFFIGFSYSMGILFLFTGFLIMFAYERKSLLIIVAFLTILIGISIKYFHPIAYGIQFVTLLAVLKAIRNKEYAQNNMQQK